MYLTKRQKQILDFIRYFIETNGYAPSLEEIGGQFGLSSVATVHKHVTNLEAKGAIRRYEHRRRSIELPNTQQVDTAVLLGRSIELPLLGRIAAGQPIEPAVEDETVEVPESFIGRGESYVLQVRGNSMEDEGILDGDYIVVERREIAQNGEIVVALLNGEQATLKKYFREGRIIRLQPANRLMTQIVVDENDLQIQGVVIGLLRKFS